MRPAAIAAAQSRRRVALHSPDICKRSSSLLAFLIRPGRSSRTFLGTGKILRCCDASSRSHTELGTDLFGLLRAEFPSSANAIVRRPGFLDHDVIDETVAVH